MKKEQLFKAAGIIAAAAVLSKVLGFFRETTLASYFGATWVTDAYLVASMAPWLLFSIVSASLAVTIIPVFTQRLHDQGKEAAIRFINNLINLALLLCLPLTAIGIVCAPYLIRVLAPGFQGETYALTVYLTRLLFPMVFLLTMSAIFTGYLQALERFTWPALGGIPFNIIVIMSLVIGARHYGIVTAAVGTLLATASQLLFIWPGLREVRFRYMPVLDWRDPGLRQVGRMIIPIMLAGGVSQFGLVVERMLASGLAEGSISALKFGGLLTQFPLGIFVMAVTTVLYPTFSQYAATKDFRGLRSAFASGARVSIFLTLPITVGLVVLCDPIVRILFERGAFDSRATTMTTYAVFFFSLGLIPMALQQVANRVYFSLQDTFTPMILGVGAVAVNIILNFLLIKPLAHGGLALATSLSALVGALLLLEALRRRLDGLGAREMLDGAWRMGVAGVVMGLTVWLSWQPLGSMALGRGLLVEAGCLAVIVCVGAAVYGTAAFMLGLPEVEMFINFTRRIGRRLLGRLRQEG